LRLERLLQRGIGDAAVITVRRGWQVHCKRQGRGIVATGPTDHRRGQRSAASGSAGAD
jgi:hypothetical protein